MKLISHRGTQSGPQRVRPPAISLFVRRARRLPWGTLLWCLFAGGVFYLAWRLISVLAHALQGASAP